MIISSAVLGIPKDNIFWLGYPDGDLIQHFFTSKLGFPPKYGMISEFVRILRSLNATRVVVPTLNDDHIDHYLTNKVVRLAVLHACGKIYRYCGAPLTNISTVLESTVYSPFKAAPGLIALASPCSAFDRKLAAISAFASQEQVAYRVREAEKKGPGEVFLDITRQPAESFGPLLDRGFL